jgi:hypothetical protein
MFSWPHLSRYLLLTVAILALVGCGSDGGRSVVQGAVKYGGEPVDEGGIGFLPEEESEGQVRATGHIVDGRYTLDHGRGPFPGKYRVEIYWHKKTGKQIRNPSGEGARDERKQVIPAKYNTQTELQVEVKPGRNTFDFDLKP